MKRKAHVLVRTKLLRPVYAALGVRDYHDSLPVNYGALIERNNSNVKPDIKGKSRVLNPTKKILKCNRKPIKGE